MNSLRRIEMKISLIIMLGFIVSACASIDFHSQKKGLVYYEPKPYLFISVTNTCISSVSVLNLPGAQKRMDFKAGYGASAFSAEFANGIVTKIGQTSDSKIPETISALAAFKTAALASDGQSNCEPSAILVPIKEGVPHMSSAITFPIK